MMNSLKHIEFFSVIAFFLFLNGCSGGSSTTKAEDPVDKPLVYKNEPYFQYLWHLDASNSVLNDKGFTIDPDADINIVKAWDITKGKNVKVAIIDDGADLDHEDLKENIVASYDMNNSISRHGTAIGGFIASPVNGIGIVGVAPEAQLVIIHLKDNSDALTIQAFEHARNEGVKVINCSWGTYDVSDAVSSEIKSLYDAGITVVFASGNDNISLDQDGINDESELPWVIGVSASAENNDVTTYSNYGSALDVLAPGGDKFESSGVLGLTKMGTVGNEYWQRDLVNANYAFMDGTSFSAPLVTGLVALMYASNPSLTPKEIREILISTTSKIGGTKASYDDKGFDERRAYGKINAYNAVISAQNR